MPSAGFAAEDHLEGAQRGNFCGQVLGGPVAGRVELGVALAAKTHEIVVLRDDLPARAREVEGEGRHAAAEIVDVEDQVLGQVAFLPPEDPAASQRGEPELVARGIDGLHPRQPEIPFQSGGAEGRQKAAAGAVDMDRNVEPRGRLELIERVGDRLDRLIAAVERDPQRGHHADGVLVAAGEHFLRRHEQTVFFHRDFAQLDVPVARELVPADLDRTANQVRPVGGLARGPAFLAPAPLHGHPAQHRGFARAGGRAAYRLHRVRRIPQIRNHVDAPAFDLGGLRILVLVHHVLVDAFIEKTMDLRLGPCLAEGRQVLARIAVEQQLVEDGLAHASGIALVNAGNDVSEADSPDRPMQRRCRRDDRREGVRKAP